VTGWLAGHYGRRTLLSLSVGLFSLATYGCGAAGSLEELIFWRIVQGAAGASLPPLAQTIVFCTFPKRQHGVVIGLYGIGVVMGAFLGPMIGGVMAEYYSWRWAFYILVPVSALATVGLRLVMPPDDEKTHVRLNWTGFLLLSISIACVQLVLSRGQRLDWFDSPEIIAEAFIAALAFYLFLTHSLTSERPFLNLRLLLNRNYAIGLILVTIYGMLNFTPMVILPGLLRDYVGFPDSLVGYVVGSRGIGAMCAFFTAMFIGQKYPRKSILAGFLAQVTAGLWLMSFDLNVTPLILIVNGIVQGFAVGLIWVPLTVVTFSTIKPQDMDETSAVYHLLRNIGSSFFISMTVTQIVRSTAMNYEHMTELISPFNPSLLMPWVMGAWDLDRLQDLALPSKEISRQAAMISYLNAFGLYTLASAVAIPLILLVAKPGKAAAAR
ncbi:MAG: DHA2 family efflux MFS transporter permease subunit, partial [Alphaproteobacteria bacterium]